jgi:hypothetical protein
MHRRFDGWIDENLGGEADPPVGWSPHLGVRALKTLPWRPGEALPGPLRNAAKPPDPGNLVNAAATGGGNEFQTFRY